MPEDNSTVQGQTISYPEEGSREMIEAGVFYGRKKSKSNPKMKQYVLTNRGGIDIINLAKTAEALDAATTFLKEKTASGGLTLVVSTQPAAEETIMKLAQKFRLPYVVNRWPGGTLTNFKVVSKRIEYFKKLRSDLASGAFEHYTKKERLDLEKEMGRLKELFGGLESLIRVPDVLVVIDPTLHHTAVREAHRLKIPIIALANVEAEPDTIKYLVPGNDKSRRSISWFLEKIEAAITGGMSLAASRKVEETAKEVPVKTDAN